MLIDSAIIIIKIRDDQRLQTFFENGAATSGFYPP